MRASGLGGTQAPTFANHMIRATLPYYKHGGDMMFLNGKHGRLQKSDGVGGADVGPQVQRTGMIRGLEIWGNRRTQEDHGTRGPSDQSHTRTEPHWTASKTVNCSTCRS